MNIIYFECTTKFCYNVFSSDFLDLCWPLSEISSFLFSWNQSSCYRLTKSDFREPVNIGSDEMVSMNEMAEIVLSFEDKKLPIHHIPGPEGVRGRNSDNTLIKEKLGWAPSMRLKVTLFFLRFLGNSNNILTVGFCFDNVKLIMKIKRKYFISTTLVVGGHLA